jgi:uncharacterized protein (TIGR03435 family)
MREQDVDTLITVAFASHQKQIVDAPAWCGTDRPNNSMSDFALGMQGYLENPVVDQTELAGRFDFTLQWTPNDSQATNLDAPGIFTAVQEQLGLKWVPVKASIDVLVIDHIEKPSQN